MVVSVLVVRTDSVPYTDVTIIDSVNLEECLLSIIDDVSMLMMKVEVGRITEETIVQRKQFHQQE